MEPVFFQYKELGQTGTYQATLDGLSEVLKKLKDSFDEADNDVPRSTRRECVVADQRQRKFYEDLRFSYAWIEAMKTAQGKDACSLVSIQGDPMRPVV